MGRPALGTAFQNQWGDQQPQVCIWRSAYLGYKGKDKHQDGAASHTPSHTHTHKLHNTHSYVNTQTYSYTHNTFSHIYSHYTWTCITLSHTFTQCYMHANPHTYTHIPSIYKHITCKFTLSYTHTHIYMPSHECTYTHITVQMYTGLCRAYWVTSGHEGRGRRPPNCLQNIS